ncbi:hypothetical protein DIPPA_14676 [Diplonema papillatum]|nr:hypothetical protein DIPPA_14676 [Diplonema papillatum]
MSLGWLAETTVLPQEQRDISGVSKKTFVELRAELIRRQQGGADQKKQPASDKTVTELLKKNKGVTERSSADEEATARAADVESHLRVKALQYKQLAEEGAREATDGGEDEQLVDFEAKRLDRPHAAPSRPKPVISLFAEDHETARTDGGLKPLPAAGGATGKKRVWDGEEEEEAIRRAERRRVIEAIAVETKQARAAAREAKAALHEKKIRRVAIIRERRRQRELDSAAAAAAAAAATPRGAIKKGVIVNPGPQVAAKIPSKSVKFDGKMS